MNLRKVSLKSQKDHLDLPLLVITLILVVFGLLLVYDVSVIQGLKYFKDSHYYIRQQLLWVVFGVISLIFFSYFDYRRFNKLAIPLLLFSILLLLVVFIPGLGAAGGGAHRWFRIGQLTVQPAEIIKLTGVIFLASVFAKKVRALPVLGLVFTVTLITAVFQRDLGTSFVFVATSVLLYFASGGPIWQLLLGLPVGGAFLATLIVTSSYRSKRILAFLDPFSDPQGYTYHILQVLIALGSGGLFGLGLGNSRQKFEYIPEVSTDSIFAIIGEELGFLGAFLVIVLFLGIVIRGLRISEKCEDKFGKILALGLTCWLGIQVCINLSSMTALLPLTGVPLPFISYGGSALVVNLTAIGILLNISKSNNNP